MKHFTYIEYFMMTFKISYKIFLIFWNVIMKLQSHTQQSERTKQYMKFSVLWVYFDTEHRIFWIENDKNRFEQMIKSLQ